MLRPNELKRKLAAGQVCLGAMLNFPSPHAMEIAGIGGLDFVIIDAEHGPMGPESCENMVRAAHLVGLTPLVRVAQNEPQVILRYLDIASAGVQVPMLNSAEDVRQAAASVRYVPLGRRGLAGTRAASYGVGPQLSEYVPVANAEVMLVAQIETVGAVEALPEILTVEGVDVVFIGPTDLSQSLGYPGRQTEPLVQATIDRCIAQIREAGKPVGTTCRDITHARSLIDKGVTYVVGNIGALLARAVRDFVRDARA
ncbi:MAG: hypothetical protein FJ033_03590 [Chloroflexi bacterium]|nr:hypothetical protein [Chloroflexota bacterium]